jgi:hypothetical protein
MWATMKTKRGRRVSWSVRAAPPVEDSETFGTFFIKTLIVMILSHHAIGKTNSHYLIDVLFVFFFL